jgi:endonuclease III
MPRIPLHDAIRKLRALDGDPPPPPATDPYAIALREAAAYLVDDERREATVEALRKEIGLDPQALLRATPARIAKAIAKGGMHPERRAAKVKECAAIAAEVGVKELLKLAQTDPKAAKKILKRFPGIGDPGAGRMLLFSHGVRTLAPDSNALRVLLRLGFGQEGTSYAASYRSANRAVASELSEDFGDLIRAHSLLRMHGKEMCKTKAPACGVCPLAHDCPSAS